MLEHRVPIAGLPRSIRLLHLSDVHLRGCGPWLDALVAALERVGQLPFDAVVLTGDIVTLGWNRDAVDAFFAALPRPTGGRFACMGNWEYWGGAPPAVWAPICETWDVELLVDAAVELEGIRLIGTDDGTAGRPDRQSILAALARDRPNVILSHSPAYFPALLHDEVDLVLSGHCHGGQVRLFGKPGWMPRGGGVWAGGWYESHGTPLFVHRGVGWSVAPVRYNCPPEIAIISLTPGAQNR